MDAQRAIARRTVIGLPREGLSPTWEKDFAAYPPAGVIVFARDFADLDALRRLTARLRGLARPRRIFLAVDEEGGFVSQLGAHLVVPPNAALLSRGAEPGDLEWASRVTGERLRALGIDWVFAPVADIHSEPLNPVIGPRAYGTTPDAVAARLGEVLRGFRAAGMAHCLKHFPGHGDTVLDSHVALPVCNATAAELERRELVPFRAHLDADAVMTAHVVYPALDPERPGTFSPAVVHGLLRERLGFEGVAITDALEMKGAAEGRAPFEIALLTLQAGSDFLLFAFHDDAVRRARLELARAAVDGRIDRTRFDAARPRIARFDQAHPEPTAAELARPLESLTPPDWEERLARIARRGLAVRGAVAAAGAWSVEEPAFAHGPTLREELERAGVPVAAGITTGATVTAGAEPGTGEAPGGATASAAGAGAGGHIVAIATRTPLPAATLERLSAMARARPLVLVGLQSDGFLEQIPEATLRVSASDATPLVRRVVAGAIAERLRRA